MDEVIGYEQAKWMIRQLTPYELLTLWLLSEGKSVRETGELLLTSHCTVIRTRRKIADKWGVVKK